MGGSGSTRWLVHWKKTTVEECLSLSVFRVVGSIITRYVFDDRQAWGGLLVWTNTATGKETASMGYRLLFPGETGAELHLNYTTTFRDGSKRKSDYPVRLSTTTPNYGGVRWWFHCPQCDRRSGKLHLPPGAVMFGCCQCHDLTYKSAQEAHFYDRSGSEYIRLLGEFDRLGKLAGYW